MTDVPRREVRFNVKHAAAPGNAAVFHEDELRAALARERFRDVTIKSAPR